MEHEIKKIKFNSKNKLEVEVISISDLLARKTNINLTIPHRANFYHVFLLEDCSPTHLVDFEAIKAEPYSLLFINKDSVHQFDKKLDYKGYILIFTDDFFCSTENTTAFLKSTSLFNNITGSSILNLDIETFNVFVNMCKTITCELNVEQDNFRSSILKNYLHNFLMLAEREIFKTNSSSQDKNINFDYITLFNKLIEQSFAQTKSVQFYSEKLYISTKKLGQVTNKMFGKTPKQIINERVILEAKRLLVYSNLSVKEIGYSLGINEATNFIKYFKKNTQKTPLEFREFYISISQKK